MKIGIGVSTYKRPECLAKCLEQIKKHTDMNNVTLVIATDTDQDRKGIAYRKNECLRALQHCDHIFLFDDDCWPIKDGWVEEIVIIWPRILLIIFIQQIIPIMNINQV
jgi:glycosyltransferase involved in cell wall biosynthesis